MTLEQLQSQWRTTELPELSNSPARQDRKEPEAEKEESDGDI